MESHNFSNVSSGSLECFNFTVQTYHSVLGIKISLSLVAIVVNLFVACFIVCTKKLKNYFMYRLVFYLTIADILQAVAIILISIPVTVPSEEQAAQVRKGKGWHDACIGTGFASVMTLWMGNIIVFWIVIYIVWLGWCLYRHVYRKRGEQQARNINTHPCTIREIVCVIFLIVAPFVIAIIPLFINGGLYGNSGLWCWIKTIESGCGDLGSTPLLFVSVFYYAPLMIIVLLAVLFMIVSFICYCRGEVRRHPKIIELKQRHMKDIAIALACPLLYCIFCLLLSINRIYSTIHNNNTPTHKPFQPLWIAHAIFDPVRVILPALAFILNPYVWRDARKSYSKLEHFPKESRNSDSEDDTEEIIPAISQVNNASKDYGAISHKEYVNFLID